MPKFTDVHSGSFGVTAEQLPAAHGADLAFGPSKDAVMRIHARAGHPTTEVHELPVEV